MEEKNRKGRNLGLIRGSRGAKKGLDFQFHPEPIQGPPDGAMAGPD